MKMITMAVQQQWVSLTTTIVYNDDSQKDLAIQNTVARDANSLSPLERTCWQLSDGQFPQNEDSIQQTWSISKQHHHHVFIRVSITIKNMRKDISSQDLSLGHSIKLCTNYL